MTHEEIKVLKYWPVIVFILGIVFTFGSTKAMISTQSEKIQKLETGYEDIAIIKGDIKEIKASVGFLTEMMKNKR